MDTISISKQKIFDTNHRTVAYELSFEDALNEVSSKVKGTSRLIVSAMASKELDKLLGKTTLAFVDVDEEILSKGILDVLDKDRFILNILEDIELSDKIIAKIIQYRKRGFRLSLEHFDSSAKMIMKFNKLFNYIDIIKMDVILSEPENLKNVMGKFRDTRIKLLAQNIETKKDYYRYKSMGFDFFQGYYLDKPEIVKIGESKEPTQFIILKLIQSIKNDESTKELELFIKRQPDLSFKLVKFFNNIRKFDIKIESLMQIITLMGRDKLLRWLIVYLYSEVSVNPASETILKLAIKRAQKMEAEVEDRYKSKAYLAGMFSLLGSIFETDIKVLMEHVQMDKDIISLVVDKKGIFASSLLKAEHSEKAYLKKKVLEDFDKIDIVDLIYMLENSDIEI